MNHKHSNKVLYICAEKRPHRMSRMKLAALNQQNYRIKRKKNESVLNLGQLKFNSDQSQYIFFFYLTREELPIRI